MQWGDFESLPGNSGASGSSLLAGKRNGNRTYYMTVKRNIGSNHVIDGEKVSIRYPGQRKTFSDEQSLARPFPGQDVASCWQLLQVLDWPGYLMETFSPSMT